MPFQAETGAGGGQLPEIRKLELEIKKLNRQLNLANTTIEKYRIRSIAQDNLSAILSDEKSKQEKHMALLLQNSPDIIMMLDMEWRFVFCSDAFLRCTGIAVYGLIHGKRFSDVFSKYADGEWIGRISRFFSGVMLTGENAGTSEKIDLAQDGSPRDYSVLVNPVVDSGGNPEGVLVIFHDSTELMREKERAQRANQAKSDFLVTISHEIRTPMNAIIGLSDMMKKTELTGKQQEYMRNIQQSSGLLLNLINDLLDFSKIEAGKLELIPEYYSLTAMLDKLRSIFGIMFRQKNLEFICEFSPGLPGVLFGDDKRLGQILTNLLNNAFKYTNEGRVTLSAYPENGLLRFDIADTGIGIRAEDIPRLFTPFEQLDLVKNKKVDGTGLGLSITHKLCEMMNGHIKVESRYGVGTCFSVLVPFIAGVEGDIPRDEAAGIEFFAPDARVLVVDDIDVNLMVASAILENYGIAAETAASGREAVELANHGRYDIIFMDHMMPEMDGVEATREIQSTGGASAEVPIVALTANAISGAAEMFLQNGFCDFISKPIDPSAIGACLHKWLPKDKIKEA